MPRGKGAPLLRPHGHSLSVYCGLHVLTCVHNGGESWKGQAGAAGREPGGRALFPGRRPPPEPHRALLRRSSTVPPTSFSPVHRAHPCWLLPFSLGGCSRFLHLKLSSPIDLATFINYLKKKITTFHENSISKSVILVSGLTSLLSHWLHN